MDIIRATVISIKNTDKNVISVEPFQLCTAVCLEGLNTDRFLLHKCHVFIVEKVDNTNKPKVNGKKKTSITHLPDITLLVSLSPYTHAKHIITFFT